MVPTLLRRAADAALEVSTIGSFTRIGPSVRRSLWSWDPIDAGALDGKVVVVTGATSGLGTEIASQVGAAGATVVAIGRDELRGAATLRGLRADGVTATFHAADMGELGQVRALADALRTQHVRIHAIVHNAGALLPERRTTSGGLEQTWASMVTGPHLLTRLLADVTDRVIWMSSGGMYLQSVDLDDWGWEQRPWDGSRAYAQAKRAQIDLVHEATDRAEAPLQVAMHPGWADTPGVDAALPGFKKVMGGLLRSPAEGADTAVWLCAARAGDLEPGAFYLDRMPRGTVRWPGTGTSAANRRRIRQLVDDQCDLVSAR